MRNLAFSLFIVSIYTHVSGQEKVFYYYGDSTVSAEGYMLDGKPHGLWKNYHPNGTLKSIGKRNHGLLDSTWNFYFNNGLLKTRVQYRNSVKNGYTLNYKLHEDSGHFLAKKTLYIDGKKHGKSIAYYPGNQIKSVTHYEHGKKAGYAIQFNRKEKPESIREYRDNRPVSFTRVNQLKDSNKQGVWIEVDENFNIQKEQLYEDGRQIIKNKQRNQGSSFSDVKYSIIGLKQSPADTLFRGKFIDSLPVGRHLEYDSNGNPVAYKVYDTLGRLMEQGSITNYQLNGYVTGYYIDGKTKFKGQYKNNQRHGEWTYLYPNGAREQKGFYYFGKPDAQWTWFYKNGDTLRVEHFDHGVREGLYVSYDPYGNIIEKGLYYDDVKQDFWIENSGEVILKGHYFDGMKDKEWNGQYLNGQPFFKGSYVRGKKNGKHTYFYRNGELRKIEFYKFDKPVGHWQYFNKSGNLYKVKTYKKGESIYFK